MPESFTIKLSDKPNLNKAMGENPQLAQEVVKTFVECMEEAFTTKSGLKWAELPALLHKDLRFSTLIQGILRGSLDLKDINPDAYDVLKAEVHPLAMLSPRKNLVDGGMRLYMWREHFKLPKDAEVNAETIANIFRKLLRYSRYVKIDDLAKAMESNQLTTFRGLGERSVELLPMIPALRYQRAVFNELNVGKFFDDVGFLDCGEIASDIEACPACSHESFHQVGNYRGCLACNAGFLIKEL